MRKFRKFLRNLVLLCAITFSFILWLKGDFLTFTAVYLLFILLLVLSIMEENHLYVNDFLRTRRASSCMNEKEIMRKNQKITLTLASVGAILLYIGSFFHFKSVGDTARNVLVFFIYVLIWLINAICDIINFFLGDGVYILPPRITRLEEIEAANTIFGIREIFGVVFCVLILVALVYSLICKIRLLCKVLFAKRIKEEKITTVSKKEKLHNDIDDKKNHDNQSIRKLYKKGMLGMLGKGMIGMSTTPLEQQQTAHRKGYFVTDEMIHMYERARYTKEPSTKEDIKRMKTLLKEADLSVEKASYERRNMFKKDAEQ